MRRLGLGIDLEKNSQPYAIQGQEYRRGDEKKGKERSGVVGRKARDWGGAL